MRSVTSVSFSEHYRGGNMSVGQMKLLLRFIFVLNVQYSFQCPNDDLEDIKAAYKSGDTTEKTTPISLDNIKTKLKESGIFDQDTADLNDREKKELKKLFDTVEIMTSSRNRQPQSVQNMFSSLRMVERVVKKQLKEGQVSETLAAKFHWEKLSNRHRREKPAFFFDKTTNMRMFDTN